MFLANAIKNFNDFFLKKKKKRLVFEFGNDSNNNSKITGYNISVIESKVIVTRFKIYASNRSFKKKLIYYFLKI